jgi:membrane-bound lytic murein transglycosylase A
MAAPGMHCKASVVGLTFCLMANLTGCGQNSSPPNSNGPEVTPLGAFVTPTKLVALTDWPVLQDDLDFKELSTALSRQLERFKTSNLSGTIQLGGENYPLMHMKKSLESFLIISEVAKSCLDEATTSPQRTKCYKAFQSEMERSFNLFAPDLKPGDTRYGEPKGTFFTAYYTPLINARLAPAPGYPYPIYKKPLDPLEKKSSRNEIDFKRTLEGKGLELFYAQNLFELYLLHVQGGGKIITTDGGQIKSYYISYDGGNGLPFKFISKYMISQGMITNGSIEAQRNYLDANPQAHEEVFSYCPNYIYFKVTTHPPLGSDLVPLTDNRSLATDSGLYSAKGLLSFVVGERPASKRSQSFTPFSRFMIDQDTGGAIKGKARADLYFGEGDYAEKTAYSMQHRGDIYFLMLKK